MKKYLYILLAGVGLVAVPTATTAAIVNFDYISPVQYVSGSGMIDGVPVSLSDKGEITGTINTADFDGRVIPDVAGSYYTSYGQTTSFLTFNLFDASGNKIYSHTSFSFLITVYTGSPMLDIHCGSGMKGDEIFGISNEYWSGLPDASIDNIDYINADAKSRILYFMTTTDTISFWGPNVAPVPEPTTALAGLGALGMIGFFGWRNRK